MTDEQIMKRLDEIEARIFQQYNAIRRVREALRQRVDPRKIRKDLGYFGGDQPKGVGSGIGEGH